MLKRLTTAALLLTILMSTQCQCEITVKDSLVFNAKQLNSNLNNINTARSSFLDNGLSRTFGHFYAQCAESEDFFWCTKVQAAKLLGRALKVQNINIIDGLTIVKKHGHIHNENSTLMRSGGGGGGVGNGDVDAGVINLSNRDIEQLSMKSLDALLYERFQRFLQSRQIQVSVPRMLTFGQRNSQNLLQDILNYLTSLITGGVSDSSMSEGRGKKKDDKKYLGPFIAAVMMKAAILKLAYHSIAIIAGKALIVGKIALIISAIIGLKKLVSSEGGEKTTYEIVKHPQVQQSHTYSSSHSGEYEGGHESGGGGGAYHRSIDDEMMMQDKAYQAWVPTTKIS